jgi:hypothetical protein
MEVTKVSETAVEVSVTIPRITRWERAQVELELADVESQRVIQATGLATQLADMNARFDAKKSELEAILAEMDRLGVKVNNVHVEPVGEVVLEKP